nr:sulfite exporter TauE/SafE family protein [Frankia sp. CeD]
MKIDKAKGRLRGKKPKLNARADAVGRVGGGVLLLPVFTALFGLRFAVPVLTLTQLSSNGSRAWFNHRELRWPLIGWFALGAVPLVVVAASSPVMRRGRGRWRS